MSQGSAICGDVSPTPSHGAVSEFGVETDWSPGVNVANPIAADD
jgi:hypothetical protein